MNRPHTYSTIARETGKQKRTVQLWYEKAKKEGHEIGEVFGGSRRFSDSERSLLLTYGSVDATDNQPIVSLVKRNVSAVDVIDLPSGTFDPSIALAKLDGIRGAAYRNPKQMVEALKLMTSTVVDTLKTKAGDMEDELSETRQQQYQAEAVLDDFNRQTAFLTQKMKTTATEQTASTQALTEIVDAVMQLGQEGQ